MSIDQTDVIDSIGIEDSTGDVVLTISDHLDWLVKDDNHLLLLQEKINAYLRFVESGEIEETYPNTKERSVVINVVGQYPLSQEAKKFYDQVTAIVNDAGMKLQFQEYRGS